MDDSNDAVFIITPRKLERFAYIFIILALLALLIFFAFFKEAKCEAPDATSTTATETTSGTGDAGAVVDVTPDAAEELEPVANCTDGLKNQDETDVDCGGDVCDDCRQGKKCDVNSDCSTGRCSTDGVCVQALSGDVTFTLKNDIGYVDGVTSAAKVTSVEISVTNGKSTDLNAKLDVYLKDKTGNYYLNAPDAERKGSPYATVSLPLIKSGASHSVRYGDLTYLGASRLYSLTNDYSVGDDFTVVVELVDAESGEVLKTAQKKVLV